MSGGAAPGNAPRNVHQGVRRYARSIQDIARMQELGLPVLPHQVQARERAGAALEPLDDGLWLVRFAAVPLATFHERTWRVHSPEHRPPPPVP